jgi:hypothetical protein
MRTKRFTISIPEPCTENWNEMTPTERGKFCAHCQKDVIDFSSKADFEIANFAKHKKGNFCGRFVDTQLEKEFSYTELEKYSNLKYAAALALGLMTAENIVAEENKPKTEISNQKDTNLSKLDSNNSVSNNKVEVVITAPMPKSHSIVVNGNFSIEYKPQIDSNSLKSIQKKEVENLKRKNKIKP